VNFLVSKFALSNATWYRYAEVQNYPFTTRGIKMGHFFINEKRHVVTDTPGLLWRPDEVRGCAR
jgi:nucleolar GTP-binding protein